MWFDKGSAIPEPAQLIQIESAQRRLAFNYQLDAGLIGHLPAVLESLNEMIEVRSGH